MRTNWEQIKERVELKLGEAIDKDAFTILANEAITDLNETAYIEAPVKRYLQDDIISEDMVYEDTLENIMNGVGIELNNEASIILPFEYNEGYNEIEIELIPYNNYQLMLNARETKTFNGVGEYVILQFENAKDVESIQDGTWSNDLKQTIFRVTKKIVRLADSKQTQTNELIIHLPQDFSSMIKLEAYAKDNIVYKCEPTSINSLEIDEYDRNLKSADVHYYVHGLEVHIFTPLLIKEFRLYFTKRMTLLDKNIAFTIQMVELEKNFENMLTFLIAHKWLENFVGTEDSETNNMFQKYQVLRKEYEEKNRPKRNKRRQSYIKIMK